MLEFYRKKSLIAIQSCVTNSIQCCRAPNYDLLSSNRLLTYITLRVASYRYEFPVKPYERCQSTLQNFARCSRTLQFTETFVHGAN